MRDESEQLLLIKAVIGIEQYTANASTVLKGWSQLRVNDVLFTHRHAASFRFLTPYANKNGLWCECVFEIANGATVEWKAGSNSGHRARVRKRLHLTFVADEKMEPITTEDLGDLASGAVLTGRLRLLTDHIKAREEQHRRMSDSM